VNEVSKEENKPKINLALYGFVKEKDPEFDGDLDAVIKEDPKTYEKMVAMLSIAFKKKLKSFSKGTNAAESSDDTLVQPGYKCPKSRTPQEIELERTKRLLKQMKEMELLAKRLELVKIEEVKVKGQKEMNLVCE